MGKSKIAITIEEELLRKLDDLVKSEAFPSRSKAIQEAVAEKLAKIERTRLARECAKLDPAYEQTLAEEIMAAEPDEWEKY
jgi:metal-responsive CopG/Arc/MetJ family transcriptional regulator